MEQNHDNKMIKPKVDFLKNKYALAAILLASVVSGFVIFRSFASTQSVTGKVTIQGTLEMTHKDNFIDKKSETEYAIIDNTGSRTPLKLTEEPQERSGNARVEVTGKVVAGKLVADTKTGLKTLQSSASNAAVRQLTNQAQIASKVHKTAVILYNFSDNRSQPIDVATARNKLFTASDSANTFFKEESNGLVSLGGIEDPAGDVFDYVTISASDKDCANYAWADEAQNLVKAQGHNLDDYDNIMFVSATESCSFGGLGQVGGRFTWVNVNSWNSIDRIQPVAEHELTHNLGTWHANSYFCHTKGALDALGEDCDHSEYGDPYDVMGYNIYDGHTYHSNNVLLDGLGLIGQDKIKTVGASGSYTLNPIAGTSGNVKVVRILRSYDSYNNPEYIYLEYRQPYGRFDDFDAKDDAVSGTMVRVASPMLDVSHIINIPHSASAATKTLVANGGTTTGAANGYVLHDGESVYDAIHGIKIKQMSHNTAGVKLYIDQPNPPHLDKTAPTKPSKLTRTIGSTKVNVIQWPASHEKDTNYYEVYRDGKYVGASFNQTSEIGATAPATIEFQDWASLTPGDHTYTVRALDYSSNASDFTSATFTTTAPDKVAPSKPAHISIDTRVSGESATKGATHGGTGGGQNGALLCWSVSTDNNKVMGYLVTRINTKTKVIDRIDTRTSPYAGGSPCSVGGTKGVTGLPFFDYQEIGSSYTYAIRAYDADRNYSASTTPLPFTFK